MARSLFSKSELIPKIPSRYVITGKAAPNKMLRIVVKSDDSDRIIRRFQAAINRATKRAAIELKRALDDVMKNGDWGIGGNDNDLYDTGQLMESGSVVVDDSGIKIVYTAPYAALIHYGGYVNPYGRTDARIYLPPRPWVEAVLNGNGSVKKFDLESYYRTEIEREFAT